jgi:hypothetical protein
MHQDGNNKDKDMVPLPLTPKQNTISTDDKTMHTDTDTDTKTKNMNSNMAVYPPSANARAASLPHGGTPPSSPHPCLVPYYPSSSSSAPLPPTSSAAYGGMLPVPGFSNQGVTHHYQYPYYEGTQSSRLPRPPYPQPHPLQSPKQSQSQPYNNYCGGGLSPLMQQPLYSPGAPPMSGTYNAIKYQQQQDQYYQQYEYYQHQHRHHRQSPWHVPVTKHENEHERDGGVVMAVSSSFSVASGSEGPCLPGIETESFTVKGDSVVLLAKHKVSMDESMNDWRDQQELGVHKGKGKDKDTIMDKGETGACVVKDDDTTDMILTMTTASAAAAAATLPQVYVRPLVQATRQVAKRTQARAKSALQRQRVAQIQATKPEDRTRDDTKFLHAVEQAHHFKNNRARVRLQDKKSKLAFIMAKPPDQRSAAEQAYLKTQTAIVQRKNQGDKLRRKRKKMLGIHKHGRQPANLKVTARGPLPSELVAKMRVQGTPSDFLGGQPMQVQGAPAEYLGGSAEDTKCTSV